MPHDMSNIAINRCVSVAEKDLRKVKRLNAIKNVMAIASGLIAAKVPALGHERASIGGLEFEAD